jgi:manganese oxidase
VSLFKREDKDAVGWASIVFALLAAVLAFGALLVAADANSKSSAAPTGAVQVTLTEFAVTPEMISAPVGGVLTVVNNGTTDHNLAITGTDIKTKMLNPGESANLDLGDLEAGSYDVLCEVSGHSGAGMAGMLHVGSGSADPGAEADRLRSTNDASDATMKQPVDAYVAQLTEGANTKGVGNQPMEPKVLPDGTKEFTLTAAITDWEVAPGKTVQAWTYNGQVPGPWIKVDVGDKVRVVLVNNLPQSTAIHYHGIDVPVEMDGVPDVTQPPVKPGAKFNYEFTAKKPAYGMYHSHHHAEHQVPDGLLGVFQIGNAPVPAGTPAVTQEIPMVLNDAGAIGLSLNGKSFPATAPVMAKVGETVEITYYNEGLQIHPMHLHGIPQQVIAKDGIPLAQPYSADTISVAPGERYTVLVRPTAEHLATNGGPGVWAYHCHILNHAEGDQGMFGMVTTFIVQP